jgi:hypothetical protein
LPLGVGPPPDPPTAGESSARPRTVTGVRAVASPPLRGVSLLLCAGILCFLFFFSVPARRAGFAFGRCGAVSLLCVHTQKKKKKEGARSLVAPFALVETAQHLRHTMADSISLRPLILGPGGQAGGDPFAAFGAGAGASLKPKVRRIGRRAAKKRHTHATTHRAGHSHLARPCPRRGVRSPREGKVGALAPPKKKRSQLTLFLPPSPDYRPLHKKKQAADTARVQRKKKPASEIVKYTRDELMAFAPVRV